MSKINFKNIPEDLKSRLCALDTLEAVLVSKRSFDPSFDEALKKLPNMQSRDIGFARELSLTILRRLGQVDELIVKTADRPLKDITPSRALMILRLGIAQFLFMDVKDHAAVDTCVRLADRLEMQKQKGFINGVLRNFSRKRDDLTAMQKGREALLNTPDWLYKTLLADYGDKVAEQIAMAHLIPSPVDITVKDRAAADWAQKLNGEALPNGSVRLQKAGRIPDLTGFSEGVWWVQSAAASLPVQLMDVSSEKHIVDLCAAPGGKTMQLAAMGAKVSAVDISRNRLKRVTENLARCGLSAEIEVADGKVWKPKRPVDAVLVDAPCTATGTIRHQPDVLHLKTKKDMDVLVQTQKDILQNASSFVKKGSEIFYCTCSLQKAESEDVVKHFLSENKQFRLKPFTKDDLLWLPSAVTQEGYIRILPFHLHEKGGMDGFFIARLIRS